MCEKCGKMKSGIVTIIPVDENLINYAEEREQKELKDKFAYSPPPQFTDKKEKD